MRVGFVLGKKEKKMTVFLGVRDPNRITVENALPGSGLIFSTPLMVRGRFHEIFVEGPKYNLPVIAPHLTNLVKSKTDDFSLGWIGAYPDIPAGVIKMGYVEEAPMSSIELTSLLTDESPIPSLELVSLLFLRHLILFCNLRIADISEVAVVRNSWVWRCRVGVPQGTPNGKIKLKFN